MDNLNTSFYNEQPATGGVGQLLQLMQGIRQQQLFQRQAQAQGIAGSAFLGAGDPSDPGFSDKFVQNLQSSGDPYAASMAPGMLAQARQTALFAAQQKSAQQEAIAKQLDNHVKGLGILGQNLGPLLEDPRLDDPQQAGKAVMGTAAQISAQDPDNFPLGATLAFVRGISHIGPDGTVQDTAGLRQNIMNFAAQTSQGREALQQQLPKYERVPTSGPNGEAGTALINTNAASPPALQGHVMGGSFQPEGLAPAAAAAVTNLPLPSGGSLPVTAGQINAGQVPGLGAHTPGTLGPIPGFETPPEQGAALSTPKLFGDKPPVPSVQSLGAPGIYPSTDLKNIAEYKNTLNGQVSTGQNQLLQLQKQGDLLFQARTGGLQEVKNQLADFVSGVPDSLMSPTARTKLINDISGGGDNLSLSAAQELQKLNTQGFLSSLASSLPAGSHANQFLEQEFKVGNPNINMQKPAFADMLQYGQRVVQLKQAEQSLLGSYAADPSTGANVSRFPEWFQNQLIKNGTFDDTTKRLVNPTIPSSSGLESLASKMLASPTSGFHALDPTKRQEAYMKLKADPSSRAAFEQWFGPGSSLSAVGVD